MFSKLASRAVVQTRARAVRVARTVVPQRVAAARIAVPACRPVRRLNTAAKTGPAEGKPAVTGGLPSLHPDVPPYFIGKQSKVINWKTPEEAAQLLFEEAQRRDPDQAEFLEAVKEVLTTLVPVFKREPHYVHVMKYLLEPERLIQFRVPWVDDNNNMRFSRGFRVQYSSTLGPYKGGLRFHPSVNQSILKFLGFEQIFKNALTGLSLGGGKGGADFDPKGKSEMEIMRFCESFMIELRRYIGPNVDVPAGDIGVGGREIGYLFGQYKRIQGNFEGVLTGKNLLWGGSHIRPEATGYGCVYFGEEAMKDQRKMPLDGLRCTVSGAGNVAQYTMEKLIHLGAVPLTCSDSGGMAYKESGFTMEDVQHLIKQQSSVRGYRVKQFAYETDAKYTEGARPWGIKCDLAFPSATQNEVSEADAKTLVSNGCIGVFEGANMPSTAEAIAVYQGAKIVYGPAKAANAGGVATSGLEMSQNAQLTTWSRDEVDSKLHQIMRNIYRNSSQAAAEYGVPGNLQYGANISSFTKIADGIIQQGSV